MTPVVFLTVLFGLLIVLLAAGMWVATAGALVGILTLWTKLGLAATVQLVGSTLWSSSSSFTLATIPLFIFMGLILLESGLSEGIYGSIEPTVNHIPGGLLHTNIIVGAFLAATTGSTIAAAATLGTVSLPQLEKRGYPLGLSLGSVAAGAFLAPVIPPSTMMILYCMLVEISIGRQFIAGIIPGVMLAVLFSVFIALRFGAFRRKGETRGEVLPWKTCLAKLRGVWVIALIILAVLGSIYSGIATATEAAAVGSALAVILALVHRKLTWETIKKSTVSTLKVTCQLMFIFAGIKIMSNALSVVGVVDFLTKSLMAMPVAPVVILMLIFLLFLVAGCFIESIPLMMMIVPLVYPTVVHLGYDPYWFGILITLVATAGNITPPVGVTLFTLQALRPDIPITKIYAGVTPFLTVILVALALVTIFPQLALWLPNQMFGK